MRSNFGIAKIRKPAQVYLAGDASIAIATMSLPTHLVGSGNEP